MIDDLIFEKNQKEKLTIQSDLNLKTNKVTQCLFTETKRLDKNNI